VREKQIRDVVKKAIAVKAVGRHYDGDVSVTTAKMLTHSREVNEVWLNLVQVEFDVSVFGGSRVTDR